MVRLVQAFQTGLARVVLAGFVGGLFVLVVMPFELVPMHAARSWPAREGVIVESRAQFTRGGVRQAGGWSTEIRGTYVDTGERFDISRIRYGGFRWGAGQAQAEADARGYPAGRVVDVYYSPSNPRDIILEPRAPWHTMLTLLALAIVFVLIPPLLYARGPLGRLSRSGT